MSDCPHCDLDHDAAPREAPDPVLVLKVSMPDSEGSAESSIRFGRDTGEKVEPDVWMLEAIDLAQARLQNARQRVAGFLLNRQIERARAERRLEEAKAKIINAFPPVAGSETAH